jgi:hypothetical protein
MDNILKFTLVDKATLTIGYGDFGLDFLVQQNGGCDEW